MQKLSVEDKYVRKLFAKRYKQIKGHLGEKYIWKLFMGDKYIQKLSVGDKIIRKLSVVNIPGSCLREIVCIDSRGNYNTHLHRYV